MSSVILFPLFLAVYSIGFLVGVWYQKSEGHKQ